MMLKRRFFCLTGLLLVCMLFCGATALEDGWSRNEAYSRNEEYTRSMLDAFMIGDQEVVLDIMGAEAEKEFFNVYRHITKKIKGNVGYDLVLLQNHSYTEEGYLVHRSKYRITFSDETVYSVTVYGVEKMEGLAYFEINLMDNEVAENLAPNGLTVGMTVLTLLGMAFAVWMIVDCVRRSMKKWHKVLWIIVILAFGGVSLQWYANGFYIMLNARIPLGISWVSLIGGLWKLQVMLPVGAIVYFFLRKKISARYLAARKTYYEEKAPLDFSLDNQ